MCQFKEHVSADGADGSEFHFDAIEQTTATLQNTLPSSDKHVLMSRMFQETLPNGPQMPCHRYTIKSTMSSDAEG